LILNEFTRLDWDRFTGSKGFSGLFLQQSLPWPVLGENFVHLNHLKIMKKVLLTFAFALGMFAVQAQSETKSESTESKESKTEQKLDKDAKQSSPAPQSGTKTSESSTGTSSEPDSDAETADEPVSQPATPPQPADKKEPEPKNE
jgi:cytoskeletal protein RodZ